MPRIQYSFLDLPPIPLARRQTTSWIRQVVQTHACQCGELSFVFCSDEHLLGVNRQFLDHDYYTDIITFDYTEGELISGEIFISLDRVKDNARKQKTTFQEELDRVIIHGILHLCGYKDKTPMQARKMRLAEDAALKIRGNK